MPATDEAEVVERRARANEVRRRLQKAFPKPECELAHENAWQLLIATILSAQSTDKLVNSVTPKLFARFGDAAALAQADPDDVEALVRPTGFFRNKAKAIIGASQALMDRHRGEVPRTMKALTALPGVARKTANVVLGVAYRIPTGMVVDTHAGRVARRLELSSETDPVKVEDDLCGLFHKRSWIDMSHRLVLHGRYVCRKQKPDCAACPLFEICPQRESDRAEGRWTQRAQAEGSLALGPV